MKIAPRETETTFLHSTVLSQSQAQSDSARAATTSKLMSERRLPVGLKHALRSDDDRAGTRSLTKLCNLFSCILLVVVVLAQLQITIINC